MLSLPHNYEFSVRDGLNPVRNLELPKVFEAFRDARGEAEKMRSYQLEAGFVHKVMFAENRLLARQRLREKPVLMEHEK